MDTRGLHYIVAHRIENWFEPSLPRCSGEEKNLSLYRQPNQVSSVMEPRGLSFLVQVHVECDLNLKLGWPVSVCTVGCSVCLAALWHWR